MLGLLAISSFGFALKTNEVQPVVEVRAAAPTRTYTNNDAATYYNGIDDSLTGDALLSALRSLNSSKRRSTVGYSSMGTSASGQFKYTDYDPATVKYDSNNQPYGTAVQSFYSGNSCTSFNREHVWPDSHGGNKVEADIHMPRPTIPSENGSRGNSFYVEGMKHQSNGWDPAMESFGVESYRGDSARIIFYCVVADSRLSLIDANYHQTSRKNNDDLMGKLSDMIKWNLKYPVLQREKNRNEGAEYLQGNRNPFIDHPEYVCKIWGNTNDATRALCNGGVTPVDPDPEPTKTPTGLQITPPTKTEYKVGESLDKSGLAVYVKYSDNTQSQSPLGESQYTTNAPATFETAGQVTITVNATVESVSLSGNFTINVTANDPQPSGGGNKGCGGNIATTSIVLCSLAFIGVTGIVISYFVRKKKKS